MVMVAESAYQLISIHAPCEGGDWASYLYRKVFFDFNPRPLRGGRRKWYNHVWAPLSISIHAPREGGD